MTPQPLSPGGKTWWGSYGTSIVDYNKHISGVNLLDQMLSCYPFTRKSLKWTTKVFYFMETTTTRTTILFFFYLNASTLVNTDAVMPEAAKRHFGHPVCHHPNTCCQDPKRTRSLACADQQKRKQRAEHCFNLTQSYLYIPNNEQVQEIMDTIHMQDTFQVNVAL